MARYGWADVRCALCEGAAEMWVEAPTGRGAITRRIECSECAARYILVDPTDIFIAQDRFKPLLYKVAAWVAERNAVDDVPRIISGHLEHLVTVPDPSFAARMDRLLMAVTAAGVIDELVDFEDPLRSLRLRAASWAKSHDELRVLLKGLASRKLVRLEQGANFLHFEVTPEGYVESDRLRTQFVDSSVGFAAMWFDPRLSIVYDRGIRLGIEGAGYKAVRVDRTEHANRIDDEIIAHLRRARFVVADFTGNRQSVYYEAGFAHGLGRPVIATVRKKRLHRIAFDLRQYNCIDWETPEELATRLQQRIEAMLGAGPHKVVV